MKLARLRFKGIPVIVLSGFLVSVFLAASGYRLWQETSRQEIHRLLWLSFNGICNFHASTKRSLPNKVKRMNAEIATGSMDQSWRVLVHYTMVSSSFMAHYDLDLPYDSPKNWGAARSVAFKLDSGDNNKDGFDPSFVYRLGYGVAREGVHSAQVLRIAGVGTLGEGFRPDEALPDGNNATILMVYAPTSTVVWTQPCDLDIDGSTDCGMPLADWMRQPDRYVLFADGSVRRLAKDTTIHEFVALCTPAGGETVDLTRHALLPRLSD